MYCRNKNNDNGCISSQHLYPLQHSAVRIVIINISDVLVCSLDFRSNIVLIFRFVAHAELNNAEQN